MQINMRRISYFIVYFLVFVITGSIFAVVPEQGNMVVIVAAQTAKPPIIDGIIENAEWGAVKPEKVTGIGQVEPGSETTVRLMYDQANLYVAFECREPSLIQRLIKPEDQREGVIWNFDCVELILDPYGKRQKYYRLAVSPHNRMTYAARIGFNKPGVEDQTWSQPWVFSTKVDPVTKKWTVETAIPFKSLNVAPPESGSIWLGNFGRERPEGFQSPMDFYLWSQIAAGHNDPAAFGVICFGKIAEDQLHKLEPSKHAAKKPGIRGWSDPATVTVGQNPDGSAVLPCDQIITPAGRQVTFPDRPLDLMLSPDGRWLVVITSYSILVINPLTGEVKSLRLPSGRANSFHGILFYPDSCTVYSAGNNGELEVVKIDDQGQPLLQAPWQLGKKALSGVAKSPDGNYLFTADTTANSLIVADLSSRQILNRIPVGIAPYAVAVGPDSRIYVSNMGGQNPTGGMIVAQTRGSPVAVDPETDVPLAGTVAVIKYSELTTNLNTEIKCSPPEFIEVGRMPGHMVVNPGGTRLFVVNANDDTVSVIDLKANKVTETINVRPAIDLPFGSQPSALAISPDGKRIYVANAGNNAVAVIKLGKAAGVEGGAERSSITGYIPVGWMPGALQISPDGKRLYVANVRGLGSVVSPWSGGFHVGEVLGLVCMVDIPADAKLAEYSRQVMDNNRQIYALSNFRPRRAGDRLVPVPTRPGEGSVFKHVIYIIRENHTYDQDFGDFEKGNGDPRFCSCDATVTPNARAIAGQFVLLDNYHVPSDQSPSGHLWLSQAINTLYYEKALGQWPRGYSYEGRDALAFAGSSFIWVNTVKHGLTFRNYGEAATSSLEFSDQRRSGSPQWRDAWYDYRHNTSSVLIKTTGNLHSNRKYTCPDYPGYTYVIPDVRRAQIFINELKEYEAKKYFPDFVLIWLPNNHTSGTTPGLPKAPAQVADNDQALGMIVDAVSRSVFWPETVIFTTEDDPWNGTDHVAGSRSICLTASPYTKRGRVISTCYSMIGLIKTIELILGLPMMNQLDLAARPMLDCFTEKPDFTPYTYIPAKIPLDQITPSLSALKGEDLFWARQSMTLPLTESEDAFLDEADPNKTALFQQVFWYAMVGKRKPYPIITEQGDIFVAQTNICNRLFFDTEGE